MYTFSPMFGWQSHRDLRPLPRLRDLRPFLNAPPRREMGDDGRLPQLQNWIPHLRTYQPGLWIWLCMEVMDMVMVMLWIWL